MKPTPAHPNAPDLIGFFTQNPLFHDLSPQAEQALAAGLTEIHLAEGDRLCRQGEPGDSMFVLISGRLRVERTDGPGQANMALDDLTPGMTVGEMALLTGRPRSATVLASAESRLVCLSAQAFDDLNRANPAVVHGLLEAVVPRMRRTQLAGVLTRIFGAMEVSALHELQERLEWISLSSGDVLCRQGEVGDSMFILVNGRLSIDVAFADDSHRIVGEVSPGETVGEFALLTDEVRTATVYAIRESNVVRFTRQLFEEMIEDFPHVMLAITRSMVRRRQRTLRFSSANLETALTFALIPTAADVPTQAFGMQLAELLGQSGEVLYLNAQRFDEFYGKPGASQIPRDNHAAISVAGWLSEQESRYRFILFEADPAWTPWSQRCVHQSDRVLLLGQAGSSPALSKLERDLDPMPQPGQVELVLLHAPDARQPAGTAAWLAGRSVRTHHHVRLGNGDDFGRLGRRLQGKAVGLVLGGGGARGFAHIGAIKALEEAGIRPDLIGGTSMGGLVGGLCATDHTYQDMIEMAKRFASPKSMYDYTLPFASIFASAKVSTVLRGFFGGVAIEDLWRPFFCVSTNLTKAESFIHTNGFLRQAVRASTSIPGIFAPIVYNGDVLVDGGIMNNFPIDIMRTQVEGGLVIAVEASPRKEHLRNYDFGDSISGWRVLASRLNPFRPSMRVPSIFTTLLRATEVNSAFHAQFAYADADLVIEPPIAKFRTMEFGSYAEIIETGYHATKERLAVWAAEKASKG